VAFSPDGHRLATTSADKNARIWDATSGQECLSVTHKGVRSNARGRPPNVHGRTVAFSPDGYRLATASDDHTARIWDTTNGQQLATVTHDDSVQASPVEERALWRSQLAWVTHKGWVQGVAFSSDGHWLATASDDMTARIWALSDDE
jgi:WD40 repeat protein